MRASPPAIRRAGSARILRTRTLEHGPPVVAATSEATLVHVLENLGGAPRLLDAWEKESRGRAPVGLRRASGGAAAFAPRRTARTTRSVRPRSGRRSADVVEQLPMRRRALAAARESTRLLSLCLN